MELLEIVKERHSVRSYKDKKIEDNVVSELMTFIEACNKESGLHIQLVLNETKAFSGAKAHYGKLSGVSNYIAIVGDKNRKMDEVSGYFGEKVVIKAQSLGLNSCWVALTFDKIKNAFQINPGEKLYIVIALGYGTTSGVQHKSKEKTTVAKVKEDAPSWFWNGVEYALLAPTAMNQQKFSFTFDGNKVIAKAGIGFYTKLDLGIVKYHFELGAGKDNFVWG